MLLLVRVLVGGLLAWAIAGKVRAPARSREALTNVVPGHPVLLWASALAVEVAALGTVVAAPRPALIAPALLFAAFALLLGRAVHAGADGAPCGCFGARSTVSRPAVVRNAAVAALLAAAALVPERAAHADAGTVQWVLLASLGVAVVALGAAVLALAREVGALRIALGSTGVPLELEHEGPPVGTRVAVDDWADPDHGGLLVAVFTSAGCAMCAGLGPAIGYLARDPWLQVATFDEEADQAQWVRHHVPGSPYAVVLEADGTVLAKGTFNGLPQLEGLVAAGARRRERALADV